MTHPNPLRQASALTVALHALESRLVRVEVDCARGLPGFHLVGLPEACVRESRTRVRAALRHLGIDLNEHAVTVNLAPADLRKSGTGFDLAIACAVLAALGKVPAGELASTVLLGELSLGGEVCAIRGVLPSLVGARAQGVTRAIVPRANGGEGRLVAGLEVFVADTLADVARHLLGEPLLGARELPVEEPPPLAGRPDFAEVRGQLAARRALEIAAAGHHNVLMIGPPGTGKTMLARRLPSILPPLSEPEALEITAIHSVAGIIPAEQGLLRERPFRAPHHTVSSAALLGGGSTVRPGEVSLAHHGCLFLDELLEFRREVIDGMRQPLEEGRVTISRVRHVATFPARPLLVAAVNPCPCGYHGSDGPRRCVCSHEAVARYRARLSGPILDRIDLHVGLASVGFDELASNEGSESSSAIRARVVEARRRQAARHEAGETGTRCNSELSGVDLDRVAPLSARSRELLERTMTTLGMSARAFVRLRRVARTIADLAAEETVSVEHVAEAVAARHLDRASPGLRLAS